MLNSKKKARTVVGVPLEHVRFGHDEGPTAILSANYRGNYRKGQVGQQNHP